VLVVLARLAASALVLLTGFRAVSDDDFARVVIAQRWAAAPRLDPSGTSWLPFPFWLNGVVLLASRSLDVARAVALLLGVAASLLVTLAALRLARGDRRAALAGALLAAVFPWSARLGVATVPELLTAALALFALSTLVGPDPRGLARLAGASTLFCACLSRYEVWPLAAAFAALSLADAFRRRAPDAPKALPLASAAGLALLGPALWIAWNHHARGNALDFLDRVAAYRRALGGSSDDGLFTRLCAYPLALARQEPELFGALLVVGLLALLVAAFRPLAAAALRPYARPAALALFQLAALSAAMIKDGAPTHHPERALLVLLLLEALVLGHLAALLLPRAAPGQRKAALLGLAAVLGAGLLIRRAHTEGFLPRHDEVALGRALRERARPGERVLVDVVDYGHFALTAALGRPEDVELDRDIDPRKPPVPSSFTDPEALARRLRETGARWVTGRTSSATATLGEPLIVVGPFGLWEAPRHGH
jgi:hypothetical protein